MPNVKSADEWKKIIGQLSDREFEQLCYQLIRSMQGFVNVKLRDGSADRGRDIDAEYISDLPDRITQSREQWRFECKKYSNGISFATISNKINYADSNRIDKLAIMSNMHLTPQCQDEIESTKGNRFTQVIDWTGIRFQDILFQYPDICEEYYPDEEIPKRLKDIESPQELIKVTNRAGSHFGFEFQVHNVPSILSIY